MIARKNEKLANQSFSGIDVSILICQKYNLRIIDIDILKWRWFLNLYYF